MLKELNQFEYQNAYEMAYGTIDYDVKNFIPLDPAEATPLDILEKEGGLRTCTNERCIETENPIEMKEISKDAAFEENTKNEIPRRLPETIEEIQTDAYSDMPDLYKYNLQ